jgi:histidyl-tRNA synthetase
MKKQISAIKGTKDILPREAKKWQHVESVTKRILELYAYKEIRTPIFEATELFEKGTGQTTDIVIKEMYTFKDKAGRSLTLRPEYTPSVARSIIENGLYLQPEPLRLYYIGPMFRYDKPQKGRYRQFHQLDIEVFGDQDPALDAEIVEMANYLLRELNVSDTENLVNSVGCRKCRPSYIKDLRSAAEQVRDELCQDCRRKVDLNPLRIFDCKVETCRELAKTFPEITDYLCQECKEHFSRFCDYLAFYGLDYKIEPRLVRGIDYYTKTTFEVISSKLGAQNALIGGGRYDDMMKDFGGPDLCAIGFAMGIERLISVVPFKEEKGEYLYLAYLGDESKRAGMKAVQFLRSEGVECLIEYKERSMKSQMSRANKLGADWVLIIGEEEVKAEKFKLKNMDSGLQVEGTQDEILKIIRESS